jgi:hypothetical protein
MLKKRRPTLYVPPPEPTDPLRAQLIASGRLKPAPADYVPPLRAYPGRALDEWTDVEPEKSIGETHGYMAPAPKPNQRRWVK